MEDGRLVRPFYDRSNDDRDPKQIQEFVMPSRMIARVSILPLTLLVAGPVRAVDLMGREVIESWPAVATDAHPRNSEGDTVILKDGSLLVGWTEFQRANTDFTAAHIAGRKSLDGGRTWGEQFVLQKNIGKMNTMSLSFLRLNDSGELLMFVLVKNSREDLDLVMCRSNDEAATWSDPELITTEHGYHIMNNSRALQLSTGRILCPVSTTPLIHSSEHPLKNVCYFSDDEGRTWKRSRDAVSVPKRGAMEPGLIERHDGSILQIIGRRWGVFGFLTPRTAVTRGAMRARGASHRPKRQPL